MGHSDLRNKRTNHLWPVWRDAAPHLWLPHWGMTSWNGPGPPSHLMRESTPFRTNTESCTCVLLWRWQLKWIWIWNKLVLQTQNKRPPTTRLSWHCPFNVVGSKDWLLNAAALHQIIGEHGWTHAILGITGHKQQLNQGIGEETRERVERVTTGCMRIWLYNQEDSSSCMLNIF